MSPEITQIAVAVAATLAPFTPFLVEGGKAFAGEAGEAAWERAKAIWKRLRARFGENAKIRGAALMASAEPESASARETLASVLAECLQEKPEVARELLDLLGGPGPLQQILAERGGRVVNAVQELQGQMGTQVISSRDGASIEGVRQIVRD